MTLEATVMRVLRLGFDLLLIFLISFGLLLLMYKTPIGQGALEAVPISFWLSVFGFLNITGVEDQTDAEVLFVYLGCLLASTILVVLMRFIVHRNRLPRRAAS